MHTPELKPQVEAARRRGGTVAMKLRVLQGKRARLRQNLTHLHSTLET
jgi:hypothetical protein